MEQTEVKIMKRHTIADITVGPDYGEQPFIDNSNLIVFGCLAFVVLLLGILISMNTSSIVPFLSSLPAALALLYSLKKQLNIKQAVQKETYRVYEDICLDKKRISDSDPISIDTREFLMEQHGWLTLSADDFYLFDAAEPGDKFYLLWIPDSEIIRLFSRKTWTLDPDEFMLTDGYYVPVTQHKR